MEPDNQVRKIIHIDMDAFYASVEQRDNPELKGRPVAVGGSSDRGVVAAASYEARKYGVKSAMPSKIAARKCPQLVFVRPRFDVYKEVSRQIRDVFHEYTDLVEPLSLDEAYLDVTSNKKNMPSATIIAKEIKKKIKEKTDLTASAGISINKFLAKTASDMDKPDGLYLIPPDQAESFIADLPIDRFFGIGKVTAQKMHSLGVYKGADLRKWTEESLYNRFGKVGKYYYRISRGIDNREVNPNRIRKSVGAENTFEKDLTTMDEVRDELDHIKDILVRRIENSGTMGKTLTLKIKFADFHQITRSKTVSYWIGNRQKIDEVEEEILKHLDMEEFAIRLLGLSISNLNHEENQFSMQLTLDF
ncbi:MAG: DNA polymerase IV [Bacteroidota bacterium]